MRNYIRYVDPYYGNGRADSANVAGRIYLNDDWYFTEEFTEVLFNADLSGSDVKSTDVKSVDVKSTDVKRADMNDTDKVTDLTRVRIPHTVKKTGLNYFDESEYQMISGYARNLFIDEGLKGKVLLLTFEGSAHGTRVFINGREAAFHQNGYTAFTIDITDLVNYGETNRIVCEVNSREDQNIPPFGYVIDYMTYGGIYRDVYLDIKEADYIADVYLTSTLKGIGLRSAAEASDITTDINYENGEEASAGRQKSFKAEKAVLTTLIDVRTVNDDLKAVQFIMPAGLNGIWNADTDIGEDAAEAGTFKSGNDGIRWPAKIGEAKIQEYLSDGEETDDPDTEEAFERTNAAMSLGAGLNLPAEESKKHRVTELKAYLKDVDLWDIERPALYDVITVLCDDFLDDHQVKDALTDYLKRRSWDEDHVSVEKYGTGADRDHASADAESCVFSNVYKNGIHDIRFTTYGFRKAVFKAEGFFLNNRKVKIRGLNRHQSFAYVGYAMPESMQRYDAFIMKHELGLNAARTSHYPQSQAFIDECDRLGLMVYTELPGWQHIGDEAWKEQAVENVKEMIVQYRNHPSIILWGVRINESKDDHDFYQTTNAAAHILDPGRQTGGVRCYKKTEFQEDVYTYNDFYHDGVHPGCEPKKAVTSDMNKPYMISEYNGHMYPTKAFDDEAHREEHMLRHARVLNDVAGFDDITGSFGWCMFDYNTHKDFGSGDRICYHGVMDMFRNEKMAAYVYADQDDHGLKLALSSSMDIGEHAGGNLGSVYILTNADQVKMYKNGSFLKTYTAEDSEFKNLKHPPILIDDFIGNMLVENEGMSLKKSLEIKKILNGAARTGLYSMSRVQIAKAAATAVKYGMKITDLIDLYGKYIGNWGGESVEYTFEAFKVDGEELLTKTLKVSPFKEKKLEFIVSADLYDNSRTGDAKENAADRAYGFEYKKKFTDSTGSPVFVLNEGVSYDTAEIRIRSVDQNGNILHYDNSPFYVKTTGAVELMSPDLSAFSGGMTGIYVRSCQKEGSGKVKILFQDGRKQEIRFIVNKK